MHTTSIPRAAWALGTWGLLMGNLAQANLWWEAPALKYDERLVGSTASDPHYMSKDEADQHLAMVTGSGGGTAYLYSIPALTAAASSNDVAPIAQGNHVDYWGTKWKGVAVSSRLRRVLTGQTGDLPDHTSFPVTAPWLKDVNTFNVTNDPTNIYFDGCSFSPSGEHLYSDVYKSDNPAIPRRTTIIKWNVTNLLSGGIGLTTNAVAITSLSRIRNVSAYAIGGKDLVYYGEGDDTLGVSVRKACVYDFALGTETVLATLDRTGETGVIGADLDIMNVKIGGIVPGRQMHLYVQCNDGALFIYTLNADGQSVGALVKSFTSTEIKTLVGDPTLPRIRNFEVTNDERFAFMLNPPSSGGAANIRLHVLWTPPVQARAWYKRPALKVKEEIAVSNPQYLNKDAGDRYLFLPAGTGKTAPAYLYDIPRLTAAGCADEVAPIAAGVPAGTLIYHEDFDGIETATTDATLAALGWQKSENTPPGLAHTATYTVSGGKLTTDNLDATAGGSSNDSYALIKPDAFMQAFCTNDYTYQYDVTYRATSDNGFRYVSLLCNYTGTNVYNTVDLRMHGDGYNQARIGSAWPHYNNTTCPLRATGTNALLYRLFGQSLTTDLNQLGLKDKTVTLRVEMSRAQGPAVYVNNMLVSKMAVNPQNWTALRDMAYALCFKTSRDIKAEIDNLMVWTGCSPQPVQPPVPAGTMIYEQDFDGIEAASNAEVEQALGWDIVETPAAPLNTLAHTAHYSIQGGKLTTDNLSETVGLSNDSYAIIKPSDYMRTFCTNDYSYQYDVTYLDASTNNFRYVAILCNYTGSNVYNTVDVRIRGEGYNQIRHNNNKWELYNKNTWPLNATGLNSMMYMLYGKPYYTPANYSVLYYNTTNVTLTVRVHMSMAKGPSVYVNDMLVSQMDQNQSFWGERTNWNAYAICFKTSNKVKAEIDNLKIWTGCGAPPVWKSGAVSGRDLRVVTGSGGAPLASSSLALNAPWTRDTSVIQSDAQTVQFDTLDFGRDGSCLYTDNRSGAPRNRIVKWDVGSLTSNGVSLVSNAVYATSVNGLSAINVYGIGDADLVYYGESVVTNGGAASVCVLDPATGTESLLISGVPGRVANVKVAGIGLGELLLFVQCDDGALRVYALNADGRSVGPLLKAFTPDEIKTLLGGVSFTAMRSFEVTNDGRHAFFTFDGADALYVVEGLPPRSGMVLTLGGE